MRSIARLSLAVISLGALIVAWRAVRTSPTHNTPRRATIPPAAGILSRKENPGALPHPLAPIPGPNAGPASTVLLHRLAYAQAWNEPQPPALAVFRDWAERYRDAVTPAARRVLEAEGVALAQARRPVMRELITQDPARALALTVPATVRQVLPAAVVAELETRVAGKGDYSVFAACAGISPTAFIDRVQYTAHTYGRRAAQTTKEGTSLHGIALDRELALHESPLRVLEPGETLTTTEPTRLVSDFAIEKPFDLASKANPAALSVVEAAGRIWEFYEGSTQMLEAFEARLVAAESGVDSRVALPLSGTITPVIAAAAPTPWTTGTTKLLLIRIDFSDLPGEPVSAAVAQATLDNEARPFFEASSYGQTTLASTVTTKTYRMPQTGLSYGTANATAALHTDARALAAADYDIASYDRVVVVFPIIVQFTTTGHGTTTVIHGIAQLNGRFVWSNGWWGNALFGHELGHTYGLPHASLWKVTDGNPISSSGTPVEYGDVFDRMGGEGNAVTDDYNPWFKNLLGWLPDRAVTTVTNSGTYRVYRFDSKNASLDQPLALRINRDNTRSYWIGHRQNFPTNPSLTNGAYIVWGFAKVQQSQLLDLTTPGDDPFDAALAMGATFHDPEAGIKITPVGRGGAEPFQYLDVEIALSATPKGIVIPTGDAGPSLVPPPSVIGVKAIAAGGAHALALRNDGTVVSWGFKSSNFSQPLTDVPAALGEVVAISAGGDASGVLKRDGTVQLWGENTNGHLNVPAGLKDVRQLAMGASGVIALKNDGTVVSWGGSGFPAPPPNLTGIVAVATDRNTLSLALKANGTVVVWGLGAPQPPANLRDVVAIAVGNFHALALKSDGTVVAWGSNPNGESTVPVGLKDVVAIAAASDFSLALKADGTVVGWGRNSVGTITFPSDLPRASAIAATTQHALLLSAPPQVQLTRQPQPQAALTGSNVEFTADVTGSSAFTYQWRKDGVPIIGATSPTLTLNNVQASDSGSYRLVVSDNGTFVSSTPATLSVIASNTGGSENSVARLANLATRAVVGTGGDVLIPGIAIGGSGKKKLIVRASGPALAAAGIAGTLAKPQLRVFSGQTVLAENTGWSSGTVANTAALLSAFTQVGLSTFSVGSADCALLVEVDPGVYTATISGLDNTTGVALVEVYEFGGSDAKLTAISCRARVGTGGDVLIPGITIAGSGNKKVIIRASGPALTAQGVGGVLAKPKLEIFSGANVIAENIGWSTAPNKADLSAATLASGLTPFPEGSADCAALLTLAPGGYTAKISGLNDTTGVALVEVYEVP